MRRPLMGLLAATTLLSGCAFSSMETPHQLAPGELVVSGTIDVPGFVFIPRMGAQAMYGVAGVGDLSAHTGTTLFTLNFGLGARAYLGDAINASVQSDVIVPGIPDMSNFALITLTPRLTTAMKRGDLFYGGVQSNIVFGHGDLSSTLEGDQIRFGFALIGAVGGFEYLVTDRLGMQVEVTVAPIYYERSEGFGIFFRESLDGGGPGIPAMMQLGIGFNLRSGGPVVDPTGTTPLPPVTPPNGGQDGRMGKDEADAEAPIKRRQAPIQDDDGVPLY